MRILISGASGLIGSALSESLRENGHLVTPLVRRAVSPNENAVQWDPERGTIDVAKCEGVDAVVHLSGENIAGGRWTTERRKQIWNSRVLSTSFLSTTLAGLKSPPKVLVTASGTAAYPDSGDAVLTEASKVDAPGFMPELVRAWEAASHPAAEAGIRVVNVRIGLVLTPKGGALAKMLPAFRLGAGAIIGPGTQWLSWIGVHDLIGGIRHALKCDGLRGPVNLVTPQPVTQREFAKTLGKVVGRPVLFTLPPSVMRLAFGKELAEIIVWSQRLMPQRLLDAGYEFQHANLEAALRHMLGKPTRSTNS